MHYLFLCDCLTSLSIIYPSFIPVACQKVLFKSWIIFHYTYITCCLSIQVASVFCLLWDKMPLLIWVSVDSLLSIFFCVYVPQSAIAESCGNCKFNFFEEPLYCFLQKLHVLIYSGSYNKDHKLSVLNSKHLFLTIMEAKSKIKVLADLVPGEDSLPCS